jgi:DNA-binding NtrC family response regulator
MLRRKELYGIDFVAPALHQEPVLIHGRGTMRRALALVKQHDRTIICVYYTTSEREFESAAAMAGTGIRLHQATSLKQAAERLNQTRARVLLLSVTNDENGKELTRLCVNQLRDVAIVVVAHNADPRFWIDVLEIGAFDLLQTPFWENEIRHVVYSAYVHFRPPLDKPAQVGR